MRSEVGQALVDDRGQPIDAFLIESDGRIGAQPLVLEVGSGGPLPTAIGLGTEGNLFADDLAELFLLQGVKVGSGEVLIHEHIVFEELESRDTAQHNVVEIVFGFESCGKLVAEIAGSAIVSHVAGILSALGGVGIASLIGPLIAQRKIEPNAVGRSVNASPTGCEVVALVHSLTSERLVLIETSDVLVAEPCTESQLVGGAMVVGDARAIIIICGGSEKKVGALIVHGIFGIDANESTNCIASVQSALRASQNIYAVGVAEVLIHGTHVSQRNVVDIHSNGWRSHSATHASQIDAARQTASVGRDEKSGNVCRKAFYAVDFVRLELLAGERG